MRDLAYLKLLARDYPSVKAASSEIINLMAICGLPKGTEYFFSDLHGEYEAFIHLLRSASGIIREKIRDTFGHIIPEEEQVELANLIYYPDRNLARLTHQDRNTEDWQRITIYRLVQICKEVSSKYTRSKVRKKMPKEFAYVIDELLHVDYNDDNKRVYYGEIIHTVIETQVANAFIVALCVLIQNLTIDSLHIIGDIFDRGPRADIIMDELMRFHDVDIQGYDADGDVIRSARANAEAAGVGHLIHFQQRPVAELSHPKKYGFLITNPPYGERLEDKESLPPLYAQLGVRFRALDTWSAYIITSYEDVEKYMGRKADRNRKIYNGMLKTYYYQFSGPKPPRRSGSYGDGR